MPKDLNLLVQLGRQRLSPHFIMKDFLYSTVASIEGVSNYPDDVVHVVASGEALCNKVLEPVWDKFGPIAIPFGYVNRAVMKKIRPTANYRESRPHHWDRGTFGKEIYARTDFILYSVLDGKEDRHKVAEWMMNNLDIDLLLQWNKKGNEGYYCVTIGPKPRRVWLEWCERGVGWNGTNKKIYRGVKYWQDIWPHLAVAERPKYGPSATDGRMWWGKK